GNPNGKHSPNWSGYIIDGGPFTKIVGHWTVPTVTNDAGSHSDTWVGIDGHSSEGLIQAGTTQDWNSGVLGIGAGPVYYALYEVSPAPPYKFGFAVNPGDHITVIIVCGGEPQPPCGPNIPKTWLITMINDTQNWNTSVTVSYTGPLNSAEWIEEAPSTCSSVSCIVPLADYHLVTFDTGWVNAGGSLNLNPSQSYNMVQGGVTVSSPSNPNRTLDGFSIAFGGTPGGNGGGATDCTTSGCRGGLVCCTCNVPAACTTDANCQRLCHQ